MERVASLEGLFARSLEALRDHPRVAELRGPVGFMAGVRLSDADFAEKVARGATEEGLLVRAVTGGTLGICPPFVIDLDDLQALGERLRQVLDRLDD